jgi:2',3'-cyclic-nucleotide 2'-phosphodiesterase (5'-nucleotidase family)
MKSSVRRTVLVSLSLLTLALSACTTSTRAGADRGDRIETIEIAGTNDIHGALTPLALKTKDGSSVTPTPYDIAGVAILGTYLSRLRAQYGKEFLWLDAGDEFQGSLESNLEGGAPLVDFFNLLKLDGAAIGNHEFDFGLPNLKKRMEQAHYPYLAANIVDKNSGKLADFPNTLPHMIYSLGENGALKVGVIGLSTLDTPTTTRAENVATFRFENLHDTTLKEVASLRKSGAQIIVIVTHAGLFCDNHIHPEERVRTPDETQGACEKNGEIARLVQSLPSGTVDAIVSGHTHSVVHHWMNGVPIIQGSFGGRLINVISLSYDWTQHRVLPAFSKIEGPIPVCEKVFKNRGDCNGDIEDSNRGPLVQATFRGEVVTPDADVSRLLTPVIQKTAVMKNKIVGHAARRVEHTRSAESELGDFVSDAIRADAHTDVAIINSGGIRAPWESGKITYGDVYRSLPFDNFLIVLRMTGLQLKQLLNLVENGSKGIAPESGLKIEMVSLGKPAPSTGRIVSARFYDGKPIDDAATYTVATLDFLVSGGDNWSMFMPSLPADAIVQRSGPMERDAVVSYLKKIKRPINSAKRPLIDPKNPRFKFD